MGGVRMGSGGGNCPNCWQLPAIKSHYPLTIANFSIVGSSRRLTSSLSI